MDYSFYKVIHFIGISLLLISLGQVITAFCMSGKPQLKYKFPAFLAHGLGLLLIILSGFGLLAKTNATGNWIYGKILIWVFFGIAVSIAKRKASWSIFLTALFSFMVALAAYLAILKPSS